MYFGGLLGVNPYPVFSSSSHLKSMFSRDLCQVLPEALEGDLALYSHELSCLVLRVLLDGFVGDIYACP